MIDRIRLSHFSVLYLAIVFSMSAHGDNGGSLTAFNTDSQAYIKSQIPTGEDSSMIPQEQALKRWESARLFKWLIPFCTDLTPYLHSDDRGTSKLMAVKACQHFQPSVIPDGWTVDPIGPEPSDPLKDWYPNDENGGTRIYRRVPNTICPIVTWPDGKPVWFWAWEHRKGDTKVFMLHCWNKKTEMVLVAHKDGGMGVENPSADDLLKLAKQYFRLPPVSMRAPEDWEPVIEIEKRDGRFVSGTISGKYSGEWKDWANGGTWGRRKATLIGATGGRFFYDGFNLALFVSPIKNGNAAVMAQPHVPDFDWDAIEKREKEKSEKAKEQ